MSGKEQISRLFLRYLTFHLILVILPVVAVSLASSFIVTGRIRDLVEESNRIVLRSFRATTDEWMRKLRDDSIRLLSMPEVAQFSIGTVPAGYSAIEAQLRLETQVQLFRAINEDLFNVFMFFPASSLIIDGEKPSPPDDYFQSSSRFIDLGAEGLGRLFSTRRMMHFVGPHRLRRQDAIDPLSYRDHSIVSVLTSYPFNASPKAFLVLNFDLERIRDRFARSASDAVSVGIAGRQGLLIHTGAEDPPRAYVDPDRTDVAEEVAVRVALTGAGHSLMIARSEVSDFVFFSLISTEKLEAPMVFAHAMTLILSFLSIVFGALMAFLLSRRLYKPIASLQEDFGQRPRGGADELVLIRDNIRNTLTENRQLAARLEELSPALRHDYMQRLVSGKFSSESEALAEERRLGFSIGAYSKAFSSCIAINTVDRRIAGRIFAESRSGNLLDIIEVEDGIFATIHLLSEEEEPAVAFDEFADGVVNSLMNAGLSPSFAIAMGDPVNSLYLCGYSFRTALESISSRRFDDRGSNIVDPRSPRRNSNEEFLSREDALKTANLVRSGDRSEFTDFVGRLLALWRDKEYSVHEVRSLSRDLIGVMIRESTMPLDYRVERFPELAARVGSCETYEELSKCFEAAADTLVRVVEAEKGHAAAMLAAKTYIDEHFAELINLDQLAAEAAMSFGHFSRCFKDAIGVKYVDYLNTVRIQAAKRLLRETAKTVEEIAREVGYLGANSFNATFKRLEGISPGRFRQVSQEE